MNRAKVILVSLRLADSYLSNRTTTRLFLSQVTRFSNPSLSLPRQCYSSHFLNTNQKLLFSSTPNSVVDLVLANKWSTEIENELKNAHPPWTHETVIYILKKIDKDPQKAWDFFNWVCEKSGFLPSSSMYSLMLRVLVGQESMDEFWVTLKRMEEQGFYLDGETYYTVLKRLKKAKRTDDVTGLTHFYNKMIKENDMDTIVKKVVNVILGVEWNDSIKELEQLKFCVSDDFVIRVLKELKNHPSSALKFFHWVGQFPGFEHNTVTYNAISKVLCQSESIKEFWDVIDKMKGAGHELDLDTYIKITRQFQKIKMLEDAVKLYEIMMDGPFKPSLQDCVVLLRSISACENPDLSLVFRVANKYESAGHTLSKPVYDGIHRSLTSIGNFDEAEKIVNVMRNAGYEPDNITFSQLIFGLCKAKRFEEACQVMDKMEENGCVPDVKTWTILIQGHCTAGEVDKALICFAAMMEKNCDVDADLLDVLVDGFLNKNKIEGAYNLLIGLVNNAGLKPWQATYKNLIEMLLRVSKLEAALDLLRLMKKQKYPAYPEPFVQYISKFGTVEDALELLKALTGKQNPSTPAYVHILKAFFQEGRYSEAKDLLFKCPHHIRKHDEIAKLFGSSNSKPTPA